jgi:hypothetical protein
MRGQIRDSAQISHDGRQSFQKRISLVPTLGRSEGVFLALTSLRKAPGRPFGVRNHHALYAAVCRLRSFRRRPVDITLGQRQHELPGFREVDSAMDMSHIAWDSQALISGIPYCQRRIYAKDAHHIHYNHSGINPIATPIHQNTVKIPIGSMPRNTIKSCHILLPVRLFCSCLSFRASRTSIDGSRIMS